MKKFLIHNTAFLTTGYCEKFGAASFWPGCGKYSIWAPKVVLVFFSQRPQNCNQLFQCWTTCILLGRWAELLATGFSVLAILGAAIVYWILMSNFLFNTVQFIHDEIVGTNDTDTGKKKNISVVNHRLWSLKMPFLRLYRGVLVCKASFLFGNLKFKKTKQIHDPNLFYFELVCANRHHFLIM